MEVIVPLRHLVPFTTLLSIYRTAVASMRRTEALASVKFYQILSIFIFLIRLIILEDFIRLISYNGPCVRLGCSFFLATALVLPKVRSPAKVQKQDTIATKTRRQRKHRLKVLKKQVCVLSIFLATIPTHLLCQM